MQSSAGPYSVVAGAGAIGYAAREIAALGRFSSVHIVSSPKVWRAVGKDVQRGLRLSNRNAVHLFNDVESAKHLGSVEHIARSLCRAGADRKSLIIAVGGGVVGDVAGFVAASYLRGVALVHMPTTLVAQVDSSIGGKTGVNHRAGKNLIGTFYQPRLVLSDPLVLQKLPEREYASGLYEALKYGVIRDPALFEDFERNAAMFHERDPAAIERLVARCAAIKAEVVMSDEKESDLRRILNFGHTVGHGLEAAARYQRIKHGEAVGYGMIAAARIGRALAKLEDRDRTRIENAVASIGQLPPLHGVSSKEVLGAIQHDKKVRDGAVHFVVPRAIGRVEVTPDVPFEIVRDVVKGILNDGKRLPRPG